MASPRVVFPNKILPYLLLTPQIAVIGVGEKNRYGHPTPAALSRLRAVGSKIYRTDQEGTIRLSVGGGRVAVGAIKN